jgi:hypothetical protein
VKQLYISKARDMRGGGAGNNTVVECVH